MMILTLLLLLPDWLNAFNFLATVFVALLASLGAWLALSLRRSTDVSTLQTDRATAAEGLAKIRESELADLRIKHAETEEELEALTAEHRTLSGIKISELMEHWALKEQLEADLADTKRRIRVLEKRKDGDI